MEGEGKGGERVWRGERCGLRRNEWKTLLRKGSKSFRILERKDRVFESGGYGSFLNFGRKMIRQHEPHVRCIN